MEKKILILLFALCICAASASGTVILDADWPIPGHDLYHSGYSNVSSDLALEDIGLLYSFDEKGDLTSPVSADINGDGKAEILLGSSDNNIYALNSEGKEIWRFAAGGPTTTPAVFDLDCDNLSKILFASKDGRIYALDSNGTLLWSYQTNDSIESTPVAVNVNYMPELEVLTASDDKNLYILDSKGAKLKSYFISDQFLSTVCIGDMNLDGKPDYFLGARNNRMDGVVSPDSKRMAFDAGGSISTPVYEERGPDGRPRLIISSGDGRIYSLGYDEYTKILDGSQNEIVKYSSLKKDWQYNVSGEISSSPAVSDLNADGFPEVIVGTVGKVLYIIDAFGKELEKHSINGKILSSPITADLNGDGFPEIIFGSSDGLFSILNSSGFRKWSYETKSIITQSPAVSDLDRDGKAEILLSAGNKLYIFGEKKKQPVITTTLSAVTSTSTTSTRAATTTETSTTTTTTTTTIIVTTTLSTTTTTLSKEIASVGFNDFVLFMLVLVAFFVAVGAAAKILHGRFTKPKNAAAESVQVKKDTSPQQPAAPLPQEPKLPPVTPEEKVLKVNTNPLTSLIQILSLALGATVKFLHKRFAGRKTVAAKTPQAKNETILKDLAAPKPPELKSPLLAAEEKTVNEYKEALNTLIKEENNLPAIIHSENSLPVIDEEHKEFLSDLKVLEKEGKRKY